MPATLSKPSDPKGPTSYTTLFNYTLTTYNINGLSAYHRNDPARLARHRRILDNIVALSLSSSIIFLQETHLNHLDFTSLNSVLPGWRVFYSNKSSRSAGVATLISPLVHNNHSISFPPIDAGTQGHALPLLLTPRETHNPPILLFNLYLPTGAQHSERLADTLDACSAVAPAPHILAAGDINFVDVSADTSSTHPHALSARARVSWNRFLERYRLKEAIQPLHTFYHITDTVKHTRSARLDRLFHSMEEVDRQLFQPSSFIPHIPHSLLSSYCAIGMKEELDPADILLSLSAARHLLTDEADDDGDVDRKEDALLLKRYRSTSDHLPVSLTFISTSPSSSNPKISVPAWVLNDPCFSRIFKSAWHPDPSLPPFEQLALFKNSVITASLAVRALKRCALHEHDEPLERLNAATAVLRALAAPVDYVRVLAFYESAPFLHNVFKLNELADVSEEKVRAYIANLLTETKPEKSFEQLDRAENDWHKIWTDPTEEGSEPDLDTLPFPPTKAKSWREEKVHIAKRLKALTPSTRVRIRSMCSSINSTPTSDPIEMALISEDFWSKIWASKAGPCPKAYLRGHRNRLPRGHLIPLPTLDQILGAINKSNDSSPGPDGIPFLAYRTLADLVAPVLLRVFAALAAGVIPPTGFNDGCLFLLPKMGDGTATLPTNTRPLAVNNCDNRIIASVAAYTISPSLSKHLLPNQKGFVPGRQGSDHIDVLNNDFYSALEDGRQHHILSIDTRKAFDSIFVDYLHEVLRALNLPEWLNSLVAGLYSEARVTPVFGSGPSGIWISILRGVRQGCPLSPLLFAIAFDPLIERLRTVAGVRTCGFADDLAFSASRASSFSPIMRIISDFAAVSGLGINTDKTAIISAKECDLSAWIESSVWPDLKHADEITYLGIRMGRLIDTEAVFEVAFDKLQKRARSFYPLTRTLTVYKRVLLVNIFLLPLLYYLFQFFHFPPRLSRLLDVILRELVIPLRTSFKLCHLFLPPRRCAVQVALRHPWATNNSLLAAKGDFAAWSGRSGAPCLPHTSMLITNHVLAAVTDVVNWELGYGVGLDIDDAVFDHTPFMHDEPRLVRQHIYRSLINICANHADVNADLVRKLEKWELCHASPMQLNAHFASLLGKLNPHIRYVQFALLFNALITDRRYRPVRVQLGESALIDACYVCGSAEDAVIHLYGEGCVAVCEARRRYGKNLGFKLDPADLAASSTLQVSMLAIPFVGPALTHALVCFNWAVWHESRTFFKTLGYTPSLDSAASRICESASNAWLTVAKPEWHRPSGLLPAAALLRAAPRPAHESNAFGSAGKRSTEQLANCRAYSAALLASCATSATVVFTDGSASPNPGPCGAGATISQRGKHLVDLSMSLGHGTNNIGELWAIGMVATYLADRPSLVKSSCAVVILSDSKLIVDAVNGDINYRSDPVLLNHVLEQLARLAQYIPYTVQWTPGHCDSDGNDAADILANSGSAGNSPAGPTSYMTLLQPV